MNSEKNTKLTKAANLLKTQKENKSAKIIYDTIFDFYYDDQNGIYIETGTKNTYTFPVFRSTSDGKIENILFTLNDKNEYDIYLVKYDLTKEELETLTNEQLSLIDKDYFGLYVDGKVPAPELECIDILQQTVVPIDQGDLTGNFGYQTVWVVVASFCSWNLPGGGGEGEGEGDSSNSSSNGTTGNSSSNSGNSGFVTSNTGATTAIVPMSEESIRQKNFALTILTTEQRDWLFNPLNDASEQSIYAFLEQSLTDENGFVSTAYSTANINFALQMIYSMINNEGYSGDGFLGDEDIENTDYNGPEMLIPNTITLNNGDIVSITFGTTSSDSQNSNQLVAVSLVNSIKFALNNANSNLNYIDKITSIYISATTNGEHGPNSNHYKGTAIDISRINGVKIINLGANFQVQSLQNAFDNYQSIRENFGPYFKHKTFLNGTLNTNWPIGGHQDHIHVSVQSN
jgi:hypothetical protein